MTTRRCRMVKGTEVGASNKKSAIDQRDVVHSDATNSSTIKALPVVETPDLTP